MLTPSIVLGIITTLLGIFSKNREQATMFWWMAVICFLIAAIMK